MAAPGRRPGCSLSHFRAAASLIEAGQFEFRRSDVAVVEQSLAAGLSRTEAQAQDDRDRSYMAGWRPFFHPVATVAELDAPRLDEQGRQQPLGVELLGQRLIVARMRDGIAALSGSCPHRGTALEVGWLNPDHTMVVCRYHGAGWCPD